MHYFDHCIHFADGLSGQIPAGKVVCVGLNYRDHISEMNSQPGAEPVLFMKPSTALASLEQPIAIPTTLGACHHEIEMAVLIGEQLSQCSEQEADAAIAGVGVALDLTLRELQSQLKQKGLPWDKAKAFDGACPTSAFVDRARVTDLQDLPIRLTVNGGLRQQSSTAMMLTPVAQLIAYISGFFTLMPGDIVLTGTPAGVGPLAPGDQLLVELGDLIAVSAEVVAR